MRVAVDRLASIATSATPTPPAWSSESFVNTANPTPGTLVLSTTFWISARNCSIVRGNGLGAGFGWLASACDRATHGVPTTNKLISIVRVIRTPESR